MSREGDLERAVYLQHLKPDKQEEYIEAHDNVPSGVTDAMERGGLEEFDLFIGDGIAVCIVDVPDIDAYLDEVTDDPAIEEWERYISQFTRDGVDIDAPDGEQIPLLNKLWTHSPGSDHLTSSNHK